MFTADSLNSFLYSPILPKDNVKFHEASAISRSISEI